MTIISVFAELKSGWLNFPTYRRYVLYCNIIMFNIILYCNVLTHATKNLFFPLSEIFERYYKACNLIRGAKVGVWIRLADRLN